VAIISSRATAADIAKSAGVAKSTVSLAFSAPERVSAKTRERILNAAAAAGYTPNPVAQSLKTGRNNIVGIILADLTNPHGGAVLGQAQQTANDIGYMVMTATASHDPQRDLEFVRKFEQLNIRAAIIMPSGSGNEYVEALSTSSIRFVTYGHKLSGLACDHVGLDNRMGMELLVRHLVDLGHRRIGHVAGNQRQWSGTERLDGLRESLSDAGLILEDKYLGFGEYDEEASYRAALKLLRKKDRPTALITANNVTAIGALRAARDLKLRCPEDISIATIDEVPWSELISPTLTHAAQPIGDMAACAATWLIERLEGQNKTELPRFIEFPPKLIVGQSTASVDGH